MKIRMAIISLGLCTSLLSVGKARRSSITDTDEGWHYRERDEMYLALLKGNGMQPKELLESSLQASWPEKVTRQLKPMKISVQESDGTSAGFEAANLAQLPTGSSINVQSDSAGHYGYKADEMNRMIAARLAVAAPGITGEIKKPKKIKSVKLASKTPDDADAKKMGTKKAGAKKLEVTKAIKAPLADAQKANVAEDKKLI